MAEGAAAAAEDAEKSNNENRSSTHVINYRNDNKSSICYSPSLA